MKARNVLVILFSMVMFTNCFAQKESKKEKKDKSETPAEAVAPAAPATPAPAANVTTDECNVNISLFNESAKNKQYADALEPWNAVYRDCPGANKVIYSRGREIVQWELQQAKDAAAYENWFFKRKL